MHQKQKYVVVRSIYIQTKLRYLSLFRHFRDYWRIVALKYRLRRTRQPQKEVFYSQRVFSSNHPSTIMLPTAMVQCSFSFSNSSIPCKWRLNLQLHSSTIEFVETLSTIGLMAARAQQKADKLRWNCDVLEHFGVLFDGSLIYRAYSGHSKLLQIKEAIEDVL